MPPVHEMQILKGGNHITCLDEWFRWAPPKGGVDQWQIGRSAMEFARACCHADAFLAIERLLDSNPGTAGSRLVSGEPECQIRFDELRGEPRNADLAAIAEGPKGRLAITVEAKADESFGDTIRDVLLAASQRQLSNPHSAGVLRVQQLVESLLPPYQLASVGIEDLRYQLLTATAGTLAFGGRTDAQAAVLIIMEFVTTRTRDEWHARNADDLAAFTRRFSGGAWDDIPVATLRGPIGLGRGPLFSHPLPFYLGKISLNLR